MTEDEATAKGQPSAIINGTLAPNSAFRSVVRIDEGCTATQIAPRLLLTASHCIRTPRGEVSPSYAKGRSLTVESRRRDGTLAMVKLPIARAAIHPRVTEVCAAEHGGAGCAGSSAVAERDAPDVALISLAADIPDATVTRVSTSPSKPDDPLVAVGFGCSDRIGGATSDALRSGTTVVIAPSEVAHRGSGVTVAAATTLAGVYLYTEGPALHGTSLAGLCPGDSGGPLFRQTSEGLVLVGVNSSYTFLPDNTAAPATNWFSRVDAFASHQVFAWLERAGATFTR